MVKASIACYCFPLSHLGIMAHNGILLLFTISFVLVSHCVHSYFNHIDFMSQLHFKSVWLYFLTISQTLPPSSLLFSLSPLLSNFFLTLTHSAAIFYSSRQLSIVLNSIASRTKHKRLQEWIGSGEKKSVAIRTKEDGKVSRLKQHKGLLRNWGKECDWSILARHLR